MRHQLRQQRRSDSTNYQPTEPRLELAPGHSDAGSVGPLPHMQTNQGEQDA
jgi:hypothetical protein